MKQQSWISWFLSLEGNNIFSEVNKKDAFNLHGLKSEIVDYKKALNSVLNVNDNFELLPGLELYGLVHSRYILSEDGLKQMCEKYIRREFGVCPRYNCENQSCLPIGLSDKVGIEEVKMYCPCCKEIYNPPRSVIRRNIFFVFFNLIIIVIETLIIIVRIDGAYFGTSFPHVFLMKYPEFVLNLPTNKFEPKINGFKINRSSKYFKYENLV